MFTSSTAHDNHASVQLAKDGVSFSLSTDDPGVMLCDLNGEYVVAEENIGLTYEQLKLSVSGLCMDVCTAVSVGWYERDKDVVKTSVYLTPTPHVTPTQVLDGARAAFLPDKERDELVETIKKKLSALDKEK